MQQLLQIIWDTCIFWGSFLYFWWWRQPIDKLEIFGEDRLPLVHLYTLAKTLHLWHAPHYRASSFAEDLHANLKNVAIPGTGIPLSVFCYSKFTALLFILVANPIISLGAAIFCSFSSNEQVAKGQGRPHISPHESAQAQDNRSKALSVAALYRQLLLFPDHWFAIWRHNCLLVGYHALVSGSSSYRMEAKGTFLLEGQRMGLPVSPFYNESKVFVKHVSIEGGMGIHVFNNFAQGGVWVIQPALSNSADLSRFLPPGAPLSTLRVVTASTAWLQEQPTCSSSSNGGMAGDTQQQGVDGYSSPNGSSQLLSKQAQHHATRSRGNSSSSQTAGRVTPELPLSASLMQQHPGTPGNTSPSLQQHNGRATANSSSVYSSAQQGPAGGGPGCAGQRSGSPVQVVTAVWRAGLAGKDTDHSSICFPLDPRTGLLSRGVSANHWYKLGWKWLGRLDTSTAGRSWVQHPDSQVDVAGASIPDVQQTMRIVMQAHLVATPDVPLIGWDVALTPEGAFLLEMNLSCNLFNGEFDSASFYQSMFLQLKALGAHEQQRPWARSKCR